MKKPLFLLSILIILAVVFLIIKNRDVDAVVVPEVSVTPTPSITETSDIAPVSGVTIMPTTILPGDPVFITVNSKSKVLAILWGKKELSHFQYEGKTRALVAIDFKEKVLDHTVTVRLDNGESMVKNVKVTPRPKIEMPLGIPEKLGGDTPAAAQALVENLAKENLVLNTVKTSTTTLWSKAFQYPLATIFITDNYGYNRQTVTQTIAHKGTDFRAAVGTPVKAMNRGVVRIARSFTVYGNSVVIDHGLGVQTLYMHMSRLDVKEGDTVEPGDLIGLSGDTGYAEAAHLHISVKLNGVSIDPMTFLGFFK